MEQLRLSTQLVEELKGVLCAADERARNNVVTAQYLAAIIGYLVGQQQGLSTDDKQQLHEELSAFIKHVMDDVAQTTAQRQQAFGIWRPGES